ncbi:MAG TPA: hypothetical protein PLV06_07300 [Bacteroidales bacterium]|nr:hypothetical protein [Bacteroidales bacterium]HPJ58919.1 hypothetical protein [Bacteroidales bacterium]HPR12173.1 hypothetical protein [Bacteroidales bacterium]HRW84856.1 hypothetical protein [Bacteroidales bacterium]
MRKKIIITCLFIFFITQHLLTAQTNEPDKDSLGIVKNELIRIDQENRILNSRIDSLIRSINLEKSALEEENALQKLLDEAEQLTMKEKEKETSLAKKFISGVRQQQGLNPNISLGGDFFGALSSSNNQYITEPGPVSYGNDNFFLREVELALEAPLDPFTRGKSFISVSKESISIEEAYMEWLNLPLNMNLKIGIFYTEFGPLNRYHDHALPQFDRPRALVNLFSNKGLGGTGVAASFMLPRLFFADATSLDLSVLDGTNTGEDFSFADKGLLYTGQFKNYYDITTNSYFEIRISGVAGRNPSAGENNSYVGSAGLTYKWVPAGREKYRTFDWKTELLYSQRINDTATVKSKGFYTSVQNKLSARFWIGGRIGYSELPYNRNKHEWDFTFNLDFWQSEFVFTRLQYQHNRRFTETGTDPLMTMPHDHTFLIQVCWAMGPHKHEAY